jgi:hypothetical protein
VALVFVGGIVSLGLEVSGPRLMAPYFGTTELIWAAQIGFTLIYLAIGYYVGGQRRRPASRRAAALHPHHHRGHRRRTDPFCQRANSWLVHHRFQPVLRQQHLRRR